MCKTAMTTERSAVPKGSGHLPDKEQAECVSRQKDVRIIDICKRFLSVQHMIKADRVVGPIPPSRDVYKRTFKVAWPSAVETVLICLIGAVDSMMVGGIGPEAIAAVGLTNQPKFVFLALIMSLNVGVTAIIARRTGERDYQGANRCLRQSILLSVIISLTMTFLAMYFAVPIMEFAGAQADTIQDATDYFRIIMMSLFFQSVGLTINAAQRGAGNTKISMTTNLAANGVNIVFNYLLINGIAFFPRLEVRGAAVATSLGNCVAFLIAVRTLLRKDGFLHINLKQDWRFDRKTVGGLFKFSSSAFVEQMCMRVGFFAYAKIVAGLGTMAFATHQICMNIINLSFSFGDGFSIAATSLVGQNLGAKRPDMAEIYAKASQRFAFGVSTVLFFLFIFGRRFFVGLFTTDAAIIELGASILIIIACTTHAQTTGVIMAGCLRGAGDTRFVALTSLISILFVRTAVSWILCYPLHLGLIGAWLGLLLDQFTRMIINSIRFASGKWTKIKV